MNLGDNLKLIRKKKGIKQNELAEISGISRPQLSRIERGLQKNPTLETLVTISTALECSIDELVFGEENPNIDMKLLTAIQNLEPNKLETLRELMRSFLGHAMAQKLMKI